MFRNYIFLNISFIAMYLLFFLVKVDTYMIILYIYLLLLDVYYVVKIEEMKGENNNE